MMNLAARFTAQSKRRASELALLIVTSIALILSSCSKDKIGRDFNWGPDSPYNKYIEEYLEFISEQFHQDSVEVDPGSLMSFVGELDGNPVAFSSYDGEFTFSEDLVVRAGVDMALTLSGPYLTFDTGNPDLQGVLQFRMLLPYFRSEQGLTKIDFIWQFPVDRAYDTIAYESALDAAMGETFVPGRLMRPWRMSELRDLEAQKENPSINFVLLSPVGIPWMYQANNWEELREIRVVSFERKVEEVGFRYLIELDVKHAFSSEEREDHKLKEPLTLVGRLKINQLVLR